jgi:hypothetical protein
VVAIATLDDLLARVREHPELRAHEASLRAYRDTYGA